MSASEAQPDLGSGEWWNERAEWDFSKGTLHIGGACYTNFQREGKIEAAEGRIGPQTLDCRKLATECEDFIEQTLLKEFHVPPILDREAAHGEARGWMRGERAWAGALKRIGVVYIDDPGLFPSEFSACVGVIGLQHPRLFNALCGMDSILDAPSKPLFDHNVTYEEWRTKTEEIYRSLAERKDSSTAARCQSLLDQFIGMTDAARRAYFESQFKRHYSIEARRQDALIYVARRAHKLTVLSLASHWWTNILSEEKRTKILSRPIPEDPNAELRRLLRWKGEVEPTPPDLTGDAPLGVSPSREAAEPPSDTMDNSQREENPKIERVQSGSCSEDSAEGGQTEESRADDRRGDYDLFAGPLLESFELSPEENFKAHCENYFDEKQAEILKANPGATKRKFYNAMKFRKREEEKDRREKRLRG